MLFFSHQIAIYGKSFCPSARDAFFLLMRNIIRWVLTYAIRTVIQSILYFIYNMCSERRVAVLDKVTDFLLFLGKLLIVGIVGRKTFQNLKMRSIFLLAEWRGKKTVNFSSAQGSSLSSSSLEKSKQWRTLHHLWTTTGSRYWWGTKYNDSEMS